MSQEYKIELQEVKKTIRNCGRCTHGNTEAAAIAIAIVTATATAKEEALADVDVMAKLVEAVAAMVPVASSERPEAQRAPS